MQLGMEPTGTADAALRDRIFEFRKDAIFAENARSPTPAKSDEGTMRSADPTMRAARQDRMGQRLEQRGLDPARADKVRADLTSIFGAGDSFVRSLNDDQAAGLLEMLQKRNNS